MTHCQENSYRWKFKKRERKIALKKKIFITVPVRVKYLHPRVHLTAWLFLILENHLLLN